MVNHIRSEKSTDAVPALRPASKHHLHLVPYRKPRLLIVCDSIDVSEKLCGALHIDATEVSCVTDLRELSKVCHQAHELVMVDICPERLVKVLQLLRASKNHRGVSVLVEASRIEANPAFAGVLPKYRAMPCNYHELIELARLHLNFTHGERGARRIL